MTKRMLIDAAHPEETRVVVVDGERLQDFDFETINKKQLKGNIYLAKVMRVEPSLQAAFVEYGGNRHGFLPFAEIHPDYFQIPVADRERLQAEVAAMHAPEPEEADTTPRAKPSAKSDAKTEPKKRGRGGRGGRGRNRDAAKAEAPVETADDGAAAAAVDAAADVPAPQIDLQPAEAPDTQTGPAPAATVDHSTDSGEAVEQPLKPAQPLAARRDDPQVSEDVGGGGDGRSGKRGRVRRLGRGGRAGGRGGRTSNEDSKPQTAEVLDTRSDGGDALNQDELHEQARLRMRALQKYKIQEVIRRRQILLVQVTKEERGTKGAALTTYISLAGRYCVLMPNTERGGGVSRKITSAADRKRLKTVIEDLDVPFGMSVILRTAGMERNKAEIKRDFEYLLRLWDNICIKTLESIAPCLIYEEANLIRRSIRDLYARDIDEVLIQGDNGYRIGKDFMKMLMPSHARRVQQYKGDTPLFHAHGVEGQIDAVYSQTVQLRSGGYIVIDQTEALVAIDVNSGRSTRERNIEETATRTNLEAAEEVARQLRLRDLAGLIVIDFIDMDENRNDQAVERRVRETMKNDRARIQIGRISPFGLMELSRQRLRPSLSETTYVTCPHCAGTGLVRTSESAALSVLRAVEAYALAGPAAELTVHTPTAIALYVLNQKRDVLARIEQTYGMRVILEQDNSLVDPFYRLERTQAMVAHDDAGVIQQAEFYEDQGATAIPAAAPPPTAPPTAPTTVPEAAPPEPATSEPNDGRGKKGRRRRDEKPGTPPAEMAEQPSVTDDADVEASDQPAARTSEFSDDGDPNDERRRRRGKRGGRRRSRRRDEMDGVDESGSPSNEAAAVDLADAPQPDVVFPGLEPLPPVAGPVVDGTAPEPAATGDELAVVKPAGPVEDSAEDAADDAAPTSAESTPPVIASDDMVGPAEDQATAEPPTVAPAPDQVAAVAATPDELVPAKVSDGEGAVAKDDDADTTESVDDTAEPTTPDQSIPDQPIPNHTTVIEVGGTDGSLPKRRGWFNRIFS